MSGESLLEGVEGREKEVGVVWMGKRGVGFCFVEIGLRELWRG